MTDRCLYIFGIAEGACPPPVAADLETEIYSYQDLHAVVRPADATEFTVHDAVVDGEIPPALADLLVRHDRVVRAVFATHPVLPMRFGVGVADRAELNRFLTERYDGLKAQLAQIHGHAEWGVKWQRKAAPPSPMPPTAATGPTGGRGYLKRRQAQLQAEQAGGRDFRREADQAHRELAALATAIRPVQSPPAGTAGCAYLVARARQQAFLDTAATLNGGLDGRNIQMRLTGPWPPYSFCAQEP